MTTYQHILIILDTFEIIFIGALFGPGTAVSLQVVMDRQQGGQQEKQEKQEKQECEQNAQLAVMSHSHGHTWPHT